MGENGKHLVPDAKIFIGLDTCLDDERGDPGKQKSSRAKYTFITSASEQTVVFKCLPEHLLDLLRYEKRCLRQMNRRLEEFSKQFNQMRNVELKGEANKIKLLYPV